MAITFNSLKNHFFEQKTVINLLNSRWFFFFFVQLLSKVQLLVTKGIVVWQAPLLSTISWNLLKFMSIELVLHVSISSSAAPSSFCLQSFPTPVSFPMSWLFASDGQNIGASASASVLPVNIQCWSTCSPRYSQESSPTPQFKSINSSVLGLLYLWICLYWAFFSWSQ